MMPLIHRPRLSLMLALSALLGSLSACGPTTPAESAPTSTSSSTAALFLTSSEISLPAPFYTLDQVTPAVAAGNGLYLVVWKEFLPDGRPWIYAIRVRASDGALLDAAPIVIDSPLQSTYWNVANPAVAFDGTNFLVVYSKLLPSNLRYPEDIYGKRVRASDGAVLDSTALVLSNIPNSADTLNPSVVFNGSNYVVLWETYRKGADGNYSWMFYGTHVLPSGQLITPSGFEIVANGHSSRLAGGTSTNSMGVWAEGSQGKITVGWFAGSAPLALRTFTVTESGGSNPSIAFDGSTYLVVWNEGSVVKARRVRLTQVQGQPFSDTSFTVGTGATSAATVSADTQNFRVTFGGTRDGGPRLISTRVLPDGTVAPGAERILSDIHPSAGAERPAFASIGTAQKLVAYKQFDPAVNRTRVKVRLVSDVQSEECTEGTPVLTLNGSSTTTLECGSGAYVDPGAQAFDGCGYPMSVTAYNTGSDSSGPGPNTSAEGTYSVSYTTWNTTGSVQAVRTVEVDDRTPPTLTLKGPAYSTHTCGSQWVDPGVEATDACYGNLTHTVWHTGEVNGWAEGTYTVTYTVTDSGGNSAPPVQRVVEVVDCPW